MLETIHFLKSKYMKLFAAVMTAGCVIGFIISIIEAADVADYIVAALSLAIGGVASLGAWLFSLKTSLAGAKMLRIIFKLRLIVGWIAVVLVAIVSVILIVNVPASGELDVELMLFIFLFIMLTVIAELVIEANINGNLLDLIRDMTRRIEYGYKGVFISNLAGWSIAGIVVTAIQLVIIFFVVTGFMAYAYELGLALSFTDLIKDMQNSDLLILVLDLIAIFIPLVGYIVNIKLIKAYMKDVVPEKVEEEIPEITAAE